MSSTSRKGILAALLLAPIFCSFIGIGAPLHVLVSYDGLQREALDGLLVGLDAAAKAAARFDTDTDAMRELAERLQRELEKERRYAEDAKRAQEELDKLRAKMTEHESGLAQSHAAKQQAQDEVERAKGAVGRSQVNADEWHKYIAQLEDKLKKAKDALPELSCEELQNLLNQKGGEVAKAEEEAARLEGERDETKLAREEAAKRVPVQTIKGSRDWNAPNPVFVECDALGVVVQPQGTRLSRWSGKDQEEAFLKAARSTGYVLFLVRPNGFGSFGRYREMLNEAPPQNGRSLQYGYEPINRDWVLVYPE